MLGRAGWSSWTATNEQTNTDYMSWRCVWSMTRLIEETAEQMSAEFKYYKNIFHFTFVLEYT